MLKACVFNGLRRFPPPRPKSGRGPRRGKPLGGRSRKKSPNRPESSYTNFRRAKNPRLACLTSSA